MTRPPKPIRMRAVPIVGMAFLLRLAVALLSARSHPTSWFFDEATELGRLAESLHTGHGLSSPFGGSTGPSAFLSPGYPAVIAAVFTIFGAYSSASEIAIMLLQVVFGAATVLVVMLFARRVFGVSAANTAGLICALCPPALFLPTVFWETTLSVLLATSLVLLAQRCAEDSSAKNCLALALVSTLAVAVNPALLPIVACGFGWSILQNRGKSLLAPVAGVLLCIALSVPWAVRNFNQLHAFIPLRSNLGYELWQGNRVGSDGFFLADLYPNVNAAEFHRYEVLGEVGYMHEKLELAKERITQNRGWFAGLTAKRIFYFWVGIARLQSSLVVAYLSITTVFGFVGLVRLSRTQRSLAVYLLLTLMLFPMPYYITHPDYRFRLVIDPILAALTAFAWTSWRAGSMEETGKVA